MGQAIEKGRYTKRVKEYFRCVLQKQVFIWKQKCIMRCNIIDHSSGVNRGGGMEK